MSVLLIETALISQPPKPSAEPETQPPSTSEGSRSSGSEFSSSKLKTKLPLHSQESICLQNEYATSCNPPYQLTPKQTPLPSLLVVETRGYPSIF